MNVALIAKLDAARREISADPKFAPIMSLLMARNDVIKELAYPTAATDGTTHYWHPQFVADHDVAFLKFVKLHELGHDWLFHSTGRAKDLNERYPINPQEIAHAIDHAVNNFLADCGQDVPEMAVCDRKYKGWSAEDIAEDLIKDKDQDEQNQDDQGEGQGTGDEPASGNGGGHELMNEASEQQQAQAQESIEQAQAQATMMEAIKKSSGLENGADGDGMSTDHLGGMLEAARAARHKAKDWRTELEEFTGSIRDGERQSTYSRVCRRPLPGFIRPGHKREGKPNIGVIIDTSGSMYCDLPKVMVECEVMSQDGFTFDVVCTDGEVYGPYHFDQGEFDYRDLPLEGGGGSDMVPAFDTLKAKCPDVEAVIFCTDGCISWPSSELLDDLGVPVILVEFNSRKSSEGSRFEKHLLIKSSWD